MSRCDRIQDSYERARTILKTHQTELKLVAESLLKYETLDLSDVKAVIEGRALHRNGLNAPSNHPRAIGIKTPTAAPTPQSTILV